MADNPPYMFGYGTIPKVLNKIKVASSPPRFTQDFLATKLGFPGGTAKPIIPLLKRIGFLGSDGVPTELYKQFRGTPAESKKAMAAAIKLGYGELYQRNEYLHDLADERITRRCGVRNRARRRLETCGRNLRNAQGS
jgi:hypothetical protein